MNADAVGGAVIDGSEDGYLPVLFGEGRRAIGAPQLVGRFRDDVALVRIARACIWLSVRRQQLVFSHYPQHPILPDPDAFMPQSRPDLPVTLPVKDAVVENLANLPHEFLVGESFRTTLGRAPRVLLTPASGVEAGAGQLPDGDHASHPVGSFAGRRKGAAHAFDFQKAKRRLPSSRAIFSRRSWFHCED